MRAGLITAGQGVALVAEAGTPPHDDRVLAYTRGLSLFILPFLLVAFVILYLFPGDTARLWSWTDQADDDADGAGLGVPRRRLVLPAGAAGAALARRQVRLPGGGTVRDPARGRDDRPLGQVQPPQGGVLALGGASTSSRRSSSSPRGWPTSGTPRPPRPDEPRLGPVSRTVRRAGRRAALRAGVVDVRLARTPGSTHWPWLLTPLTCRVVGRRLLPRQRRDRRCWLDPRWSTLGLMLEVEVIMLGLMLLAVVRAHGEFDTGRSLTWPLLVGTPLSVGRLGLPAGVPPAGLRAEPLVDSSPDSSRGR